MIPGPFGLESISTGIAEYGDQALLVAIKNGDLELAKTLVKKGYDINKRDGNGLKYCSNLFRSFRK